VYNLNSIKKFKSLIKLINFEKQSSAAQTKRLAAADSYGYYNPLSLY